LQFIDCEYREMECGNKEMGTMPTNLLLPNFFVLLASWLHNFQCLQSCVSWTPFWIFSCYVSHAIVSGTYPWVVVS